MTKVKLGEVTVNLDNRRKPLNNVQRQEKSVVKKYAYCGANNIVDYIDDYIFDETDEILCIAEDGGSWGKEEKCTYIMREKCWVNNHAHVIKMNEGIDINYISLFLNYTDLTPYITGSTRGKLTKSSLENIELDLPDYEAQVGISKKILSIQDLMEKKEKQLAKLNELVKSRFHEMFGDVSAFEMDNLSNSVKEMFIGPFGSALKNDYFVPKEKSYCMVYEQKHAIKKTMNLETRYVDERKYKELKRFSIFPGDIIVSCRGTIGEVYQIPEDAPMGIMHPSIMKIRLDKSRYSSIYFKFLLNEYMDFQKSLSQGSGVKMAVTATELGNTRFPLPPLALQNQFADFVAEVDKSQLAIKKSLEELETLKKSLMQAYFG